MSSWTTASDDELFRALRRASVVEQRGIQEALVLRYSGLVRWLAARYAGPSVDIEDLRQVGYVGLVLAVQRFDPDRGSDFLAFARPTVQGEIRRYFRDKRRWIRLPRRLQEVKAAIRVATDALTQERGRAPTVDELAETIKVSPDAVLEAMTADDVWVPVSLDAAVRQDAEDSYTVADVIGHEDARFELSTQCESLRPFLQSLDERDRQILYLRFFQEKTQSQIGEELGISQMHVSRLLSRVLARLREQMQQD